MIARWKKRMVRGLGTLAWIASLGVGVPAASVLAPSEARAVIGRPLTPVSYAGMARRTSRRTARRTSARYAAADAYATAPPAGCAPVAGGAYQCGGGTAYRPAMDGPNVVYVQVDD